MQYSYDETGVYFWYFVASVLGLVLTPMSYRWVKDIFFNPIPESQAGKRLIKYRLSEKRFWLIIKFVLIVVGWATIAYLVYMIRNTELPEQEIFNPWQILGIEENASVKEVKKVYRQLSLQWHPDKVSAELKEEASKKFEMYTKAKNVLTDDAARENWEKYGHPDGKQAFSMGIALPTWLVSSTASPFVLALYFFLFGCILPLSIGKWWYRTRLYTKDNILSKSMSLFFKRVEEDTGLKHLLAILSMASEWENEIGVTGNKEVGKKLNLKISKEDIKTLEKNVKREYDSQSGEKFEIPKQITAESHRLTFLLLHSYFLRIPLENEKLELIRDLAVEKSFHLLQTGILQITLARGWLIPSLMSMDICQMLAQALPASPSPLLQLPHMTKTVLSRLKSVTVTVKKSPDDDEIKSIQGIKAVQELVEIPENHRKKILKQAGLGEKDVGFEKAYDDLMTACNEYPRLVLEKVDFRVKGEPTITPSSFVTCTLAIRLVSVTVPVTQLNDEYQSRKKAQEGKDKKLSATGTDSDGDDGDDLDLELEAEGDGVSGRIFRSKHRLPNLVEAPYYPDLKRPAWWVFIGNLSTNRIINAVKVTDLIDRKTIKLQFQAPPDVGVYPFSVFLKSETFVGTDMRLDIQMKVDAQSTVSVQEDEDDISEPDEDSLAGQMQALRNAKGGGPGAHENNSSDDDSESDEDEEAEGDDDDE